MPEEKKETTTENKDEISGLLANDDIFKQLFGDKPQESAAADGEAKTEEGEKPNQDSATEEVKKGDEGTKTEAEPAPEVVKKKAPKKAAPQPVQVNIDSEQIAEAAAKAAVKTVREMDRGEEEKKKTATEDLPPSIKKRAAVYGELERSDPEHYKDIAKRLADFERAEVARAEKWESENPGESYDADAKEHQEWYAKNEVKVDEDDFDEARIRVAARKIVEDEVNPIIERQEQEIQNSKAAPLSHKAGEMVSESVLRAFMPEGQLTKETIEKLAEDDPEAMEIANVVNQQYRPVAEVVPLLYKGVIRRDDNNPVHQAAYGMLQRFEKELQSQDAEKTTDEQGRTWVPIADYYKMPKKDQQKHWVVNEDQIVHYISLSAQADAKSAHNKTVERLEKMAVRRGYTKVDASKTTQDNGDEPAKPTPSKQSSVKQERASPSVGVSAVGDKSGNKSIADNHPLDPLFQFWKT